VTGPEPIHEGFPEGIDSDLIEYALLMTPEERVEANRSLLDFAMQVWEQNGIKSFYDQEPA